MSLLERVDMKLKNTLFLLLTAIIWGFAFSAQKTAMEHVGPYTFNCLRSFLGAFFLIPCIFVFDRLKPKGQREMERRVPMKLLLTGGLCCGLALGVASTLQQIGIKYTEAGKAGFITACYIIIVPILGLFLKKRCSWLLWLAVVIALVALYLLCMTSNSFSISTGDTYVLACAFVFAIQILCIDFFAPKMDCIRLSCIQFFVVAFLCADMMFWKEGIPAWGAMKACLPALLYTGIMSSGIAYTLQIIGQKNFNPTIASIIMSMESTFAVIGGWLFLGERLTVRQFIGCCLMFAAIILAQIPVRGKLSSESRKTR